MFLFNLIMLCIYFLPAPPEVRDLTFISSAAESITLQWERPDTLCAITSYYISYDGVAMWGDNSPDSGTVPVVSDNDTVTYDLIGLVPHSNYSVQVWAETSAGSGTVATLDGLITQEDG